MPDQPSDLLYFQVAHTESAKIAVNVPALLAKWGEDRPRFGGTDEEFVHEVLWTIGVEDLLYSGDFIEVLDADAEDDIRASAAPAVSQSHT